MAKVRIALAVDDSGDWACSGSGTIGKTVKNYDKLHMNICNEFLGPTTNQYFVEVDIEPPVIETINAEAVEVK